MVPSRFWHSRAAFAALALLGLAAFAQTAAAQTVVYDGLNTGTVATFTGSTPRTFMGQAFQVADPGTPVKISSIRVTLVAGAAVTYAASRLNVQLWDTYDPAAAGTALVFSNPLPAAALVYDTGAVNTTGATAFTFTLPVATPIALTGLTNHGITFNWQSDAAGVGTFINDTLLTTALRTGTGGTVPPPALMAGAADLNPVGGYFRNASALTTLNFQASDARSIANVGGLMFELTAAAATPVTLLEFAVE
jgi:hypothetical protein